MDKLFYEDTTKLMNEIIKKEYYTNTDHFVKPSLKEWSENKQYLIDTILNGQLMVEIPVEKNIEFDTECISDMLYARHNKYWGKHYESKKESDRIAYILYSFFSSRKHYYTFIIKNQRMDVDGFFRGLKRIFINAFELDLNLDLNVSQSPKFSKQLYYFLHANKIPKEIIDKMLGICSEIQQSWSSNKEDYELVLSAHPVDFITMSVNDSGWTSCVSPGGDQFLSTFSTMQDAYTLVAYVKSKQSNIIVNEEEKIYWNNKKIRFLIHFSVNYNSVYLNKYYPHYVPSIEKTIIGYIAKQINIDTTKVHPFDEIKFLKKNLYFYIDSECISNSLKVVGDCLDFKIGSTPFCFNCGYKMEGQANEYCYCWHCYKPEYEDDLWE